MRVCELATVVWFDRAVTQPGDEQHRRCIGARIGDRLAGAQVAAGRREDALQDVALQRQEIVGAGEPDKAGERPLAGGIELRFVQGEHGRDIRARRMPDKEDQAGIGAELRGVASRPADRPGPVGDEVGKRTSG